MFRELGVCVLINYSYKNKKPVILQYYVGHYLVLYMNIFRFERYVLMTNSIVKIQIVIIKIFDYINIYSFIRIAKVPFIVYIMFRSVDNIILSVRLSVNISSFEINGTFSRYVGLMSKQLIWLYALFFVRVLYTKLRSEGVTSYQKCHY